MSTRLSRLVRCNLKEIMDKNHVSSADLATWVRINPSTLSLIRSGKITPSIELSIDLIHALKTTPEKFFSLDLSLIKQTL